MGTPHDELRTEFRNKGLILLRNFFALESLNRLRDAAQRCFHSIETGQAPPAHHRYNPHAHSVLLTALLDCGIETEAALLAPLSAAGLNENFSDRVETRWRCRMEHSWVRKKFAPRNAPRARCQIQDWHQDGALGAQFPPQPGAVMSPIRLTTCWISLDPCGTHSPGLEFIRSPQPALLHFTELNDSLLRRRFDPVLFWAPEMDVGDGLLFRGDVLHRTHVTDAMEADRLSLEYRIFPEEP